MATKRIALVTGANRGIGLELCRQLSQRGDHVIAVCRNSSPELDSLGVHVEKGVDVADAAAVQALAARLDVPRIDLLVHNAGVSRIDLVFNLDIESVRTQIEVNALGPLRLTAALQEKLGEGSKIAIVTSRMGSIGDNTSGGMYGYRMSKAALNAAGVSLSLDLKPRGVAVAILHPGYVRTEMNFNSGDISPEESVRGMLAVLDGLTVETSGRFSSYKGESLPW